MPAANIIMKGTTLKSENDAIDYVKIRQDLVFKKYASAEQGKGKSIGISKSFLTNTLYPLYYNFFTKLGFKVVLIRCN